MTKIEFLQKQIEDVEYKIIKELENEYNKTGLEDALGDHIKFKLRGFFSL